MVEHELNISLKIPIFLVKLSPDYLLSIFNVLVFELFPKQIEKQISSHLYPLPPIVIPVIFSGDSYVRRQQFSTHICYKVSLLSKTAFVNTYVR